MNISLLILLIPLHAFHLSVTEVDFRPDGQVAITIGVFADDLETAINQTYGAKTIDIYEAGKEDLHTSWITQYVEGKVYFGEHTEKTFPTFLGFEMDRQANRCWLYLETHTSKLGDWGYFCNSLLWETFRDQRNMVHVQQRANRHTFMLEEDHPRLPRPE